MTIYDLKPKFQSLLRPYVKQLFKKGITANQVTLSALLLSIAVGGLLLLHPSPRLFLLLPFVLFFGWRLMPLMACLRENIIKKVRLARY